MTSQENSKAIDLCKTCEKLIAKIIKDLEDENCTVISLGLGGACTAAIAGTGIGPVVCTIAGIIVNKECKKHGAKWIIQNRNLLATVICQAANVCSYRGLANQGEFTFDADLGISPLTEEEKDSIRQSLKT